MGQVIPDEWAAGPRRSLIVRSKNRDDRYSARVRSSISEQETLPEMLSRLRLEGDFRFES